MRQKIRLVLGYERKSDQIPSLCIPDNTTIAKLFSGTGDYMTFALHDTEGYVGDLGSATHLTRLHEAFAGYPVINAFFETGFSEQLDELEAELELAIERATNPDIKEGGEHLLRLFQVCENAAFIPE
jgi:hypothetical protein